MRMELSLQGIVTAWQVCRKYVLMWQQLYFASQRLPKWSQNPVHQCHVNGTSHHVRDSLWSLILKEAKSTSRDQRIRWQKIWLQSNHPHHVERPVLPTSWKTIHPKEAFCEKLKNSGVKSALLALVPGFIDPYIPTPVAMQLPPPLPQLFNVDYLKLSRNDLAKKCDEIFKSLEYQPEQVNMRNKNQFHAKKIKHVFLIAFNLNCNKSLYLQVVALEKMTREQSRSNAWFQYRAGRITASNFKAAVSTDPAKPAVSLIKRICYPQAYKFSTEATRYWELIAL